MKEKIYEICEEMLENEEESKKFASYETLEELYEYFLDKIPGLSKDEFEEFICEALDSYAKEKQSVNKIDEDNLGEISGGAFDLKTKLTAGALAFMAAMSAIPGMNAANVNNVGAAQSISENKSIKTKISDTFGRVKSWVKEHPGLTTGIALGAAVLVGTGIFLGVRHSRKSKANNVGGAAQASNAQVSNQTAAQNGGGASKGTPKTGSGSAAVVTPDVEADGGEEEAPPPIPSRDGSAAVVARAATTETSEATEGAKAEERTLEDGTVQIKVDGRWVKKPVAPPPPTTAPSPPVAAAASPGTPAGTPGAEKPGVPALGGKGILKAVKVSKEKVEEILGNGKARDKECMEAMTGWVKSSETEGIKSLSKEVGNLLNEMDRIIRAIKDDNTDLAELKKELTEVKANLEIKYNDMRAVIEGKNVDNVRLRYSLGARRDVVKDDDDDEGSTKKTEVRYVSDATKPPKDDPEKYNDDDEIILIDPSGKKCTWKCDWDSWKKDGEDERATPEETKKAELACASRGSGVKTKASEASPKGIEDDKKPGSGRPLPDVPVRVISRSEKKRTEESYLFKALDDMGAKRGTYHNSLNMETKRSATHLEPLARAMLNAKVDFETFTLENARADKKFEKALKTAHLERIREDDAKDAGRKEAFNALKEAIKGLAWTPELHK